jgi:hypothetical protein
MAYTTVVVAHVTDLYNYELMLTDKQLDELKAAAQATDVCNYTITLTSEQFAKWKDAAQTQTLYKYDIELTDTQLDELKAVYAKWKDVRTTKHDSLWNEFFTGCMEYTVDDLFVLSKYFNLAMVFNDDNGLAHEHWQAMIKEMDGTEVLSAIALERELLAISSDKRAIAIAAYMVSTGQV